ncbi:MAG: acetyl-coenzyme A synthetase N-terminal domain-containing protein, partial [bacterium]
MSETHTIKSMMAETRKFEPPAELQKNAWIKSFAEYKKMYDRSINDPEGFWGEMAQDFEWFKKWNKVRTYDFRDKIDIKFYEGAETNISVNCLDRHV